MSYANGTTHYNLPQTLGTDKRDWFDTNQAFADIDAAIYGAVQNASQAVTDLSALTTRVGAAENDIDTLETAIGTHTSQISAMQTSITQIGNAVTDNKQDVLDMIESTQEASATAAYAHAVGSYFIYNDTLYVTTVAIAVGDTIVPNTNCETTDIGTVLTQLNSALAGVDASDVDYDNTNSGLSATDVQGAVDEINSALTGLPSMDSVDVICNEAVGTSSVAVTLTKTPTKMMYFLAVQGNYIRQVITIPAYVWVNTSSFASIQLAWGNNYINITRTDATHLGAISNLIDCILCIYSM